MATSDDITNRQLDPATIARLKCVYPDLAVRIRRVYEDMRRIYGRAMKTTMGIRTFTEQEKLYAQGRTAPGPIVTFSRPGDSIHHYGLAVDSCFIGADPFLIKDKLGEKLWHEYGRLSKAHGLIWGGDWRKPIDMPHAQITYGMGLEAIKELYAHGGLMAVWAKCDQVRGIQPGSEWDKPTADVRILGNPPPASPQKKP